MSKQKNDGGPAFPPFSKCEFCQLNTENESDTVELDITPTMPRLSCMELDVRHWRLHETAIRG